MPFMLTIDHLVRSNLQALDARTIQAQNPVRYKDERYIYSYHLTPDGKYTCGVGCALPQSTREALRDLEVLKGFESEYDSDFPRTVLWRLNELHEAWLNCQAVEDMHDEMSIILTMALGYSSTQVVDEDVYRAFVLALAAAEGAEDSDLRWVCASECGWMAWSRDPGYLRWYAAAVHGAYGRFWWLKRPLAALRSMIGVAPQRVA